MWLSCKDSACNAGDLSSILGLGRSAGEGKGRPLQYSGLENAMDRIVHGVSKSQTRLSVSIQAFWVEVVVKNLSMQDSQEAWVRSLGGEDLLEEEMAAHSSILAWRIPWTGAWQAAVHRVTKSQTRICKLY